MVRQVLVDHNRRMPSRRKDEWAAVEAAVKRAASEPRDVQREQAIAGAVDKNNDLLKSVWRLDAG